MQMYTLNCFTEVALKINRKWIIQMTFRIMKFKHIVTLNILVYDFPPTIEEGQHHQDHHGYYQTICHVSYLFWVQSISVDVFFQIFFG